MLLASSNRISKLQAEVMMLNHMTQKQAKAWLDNWVPGWETPRHKKVIKTISIKE